MWSIIRRNKKGSKHNYKFLCWSAIILWMALIFYLSHQPVTVSNELSTGITEVVVKTVEKTSPKSEIKILDINHIIRKNAHFFIYLVLGVLVLNAMLNSWKYQFRFIGLALFTCIFYAITDEIHQLFVPGRGAQIKDVLIDSAGATVGVFMYLLIVIIIRARKDTAKS